MASGPSDDTKGSSRLNRVLRPTYQSSVISNTAVGDIKDTGEPWGNPLALNSLCRGFSEALNANFRAEKLGM